VKTDLIRAPWRRPFAAGAALTGLCATAVLLPDLFFAGPHREPDGRAPAGGIVDIHVHAAGIGIGSDCFVSPALRESYKFGIYLESFGISRAELEEHGDALVIRRIAEGVAASEHVDRAIVLALDGVVDEAGELDLERTEIYIPTAFVAAETARYEQLWLGASVNPFRRDALERLAQAKAAGAKLVKWIPSIQMIDPADPRIAPFYRKLVELDLPLLTHAGQERSFTSARDELADPLRLRLPLELGVTVIVAHIASTGENEGQRDTDRLRPLFAEFPNLFSEISSLTQANKFGYLREALTRPEFEGRLLYGSDFPLINTPLVSAWYFPLNLTRAQMSEISAIANPWDRDVALKRALGTPAGIFGLANEIFPDRD
jgi:predicted TIM-barrel fold metal-dependent hydrolase